MTTKKKNTQDILNREMEASISPVILNLSTRWRSVISWNDSAVLTPERRLLILSSRRLDVSQILLGPLGAEKNLSPCLESYHVLSVVQSKT